MAGVTGFAVSVDASGARRVGNAELIRVEKQRIGVGDIELLLFAHETSALAGDTLHQSLSEGRGQLVEFLLCKIDTEIMFPALSFQDVVIGIL